MNIAAILIGLALLVATLPFIASPFMAKKSGRSKMPAEAQTSTADQHTPVLLSIRDLDFDYRLGKVTAEDYNSLRPQLVAQAASLIDQASQEEDAIEQMIRARQEELKREGVCSHCGKPLRTGDLFCSGCGQPASKTCPSCGKKISAGDSFCPSCGVALTTPDNAIVIETPLN